MTRLLSIAAVVLMLLSVSAPGAAAASIILNGGFETGTFADWTTTPATGSGAVSLFGVGGFPHSGSDAAYFGGMDAGIPNEDTISQSFATTPGQQYVVDFWSSERIVGCPVLDSPACVPLNDFNVYWNGAPILRLVSTHPRDYTDYTFLLSAVGQTATLSFGIADTTGFTELDDVSVSAVPEPASLTLVAGGLATLIGRRRLIRRRTD